MAATFHMNRAALARIVNSPSGPAVADLRKRARRVETGAKRRAPVDTGRMRSSIHTQGPHAGPRGPYIDVVAATRYAVYVHDGTRYMRGRPFLADALRDAI